MTFKKLKTKSKYLPLFHLNSCSRNKKFDGLEYLIKTANQTFNVIAISESRIKGNMILQRTFIYHSIQCKLPEGHEPSYILVIT